MGSAYARVTAIVRMDRVERVEAALQDIHVSGVSVTPVKGYGEYVDFFARDWMAEYVRFEIFTSAQHAERIVGVILDAASSGTRGDGIVCLSPVERVWRVRSKRLAPADEI